MSTTYRNFDTLSTKDTISSQPKVTESILNISSYQPLDNHHNNMTSQALADYLLDGWRILDIDSDYRSIRIVHNKTKVQKCVPFEDPTVGDLKSGASSVKNFAASIDNLKPDFSQETRRNTVVANPNFFDKNLTRFENLSTVNSLRSKYTEPRHTEHRISSCLTSPLLNPLDYQRSLNSMADQSRIPSNSRSDKSCREIYCSGTYDSMRITDNCLGGNRILLDMNISNNNQDRHPIDATSTAATAGETDYLKSSNISYIGNAWSNNSKKSDDEVKYENRSQRTDGKVENLETLQKHTRFANNNRTEKFNSNNKRNKQKSQTPYSLIVEAGSTSYKNKKNSNLRVSNSFANDIHGHVDKVGKQKRKSIDQGNKRNSGDGHQNLVRIESNGTQTMTSNTMINGNKNSINNKNISKHKLEMRRISSPGLLVPNPVVRPTNRHSLDVPGPESVKEGPLVSEAVARSQEQTVIQREEQAIRDREELNDDGEKGSVVVRYNEASIAAADDDVDDEIQVPVDNMTGDTSVQNSDIVPDNSAIDSSSESSNHSERNVEPTSVSSNGNNNHHSSASRTTSTRINTRTPRRAESSLLRRMRWAARELDKDKADFVGAANIVKSCAEALYALRRINSS